MKEQYLPHFPTRMQALIWRNWGIVPASRIAEVLGAAEAKIVEVAAEMGLEAAEEDDCGLWLERGYITIIRANWHLLPAEQLLQLLGWTEQRLAFTLKEDDFLDIKLGKPHPSVERVLYSQLNEEEQRQTRTLKATVQALQSGLRQPSGQDRAGERPFDFLKQYKAVPIRFPSPERAADRTELRLDTAWAVECAPGNALVERALETFAAKMEEAWGVRLSGVGQRGMIGENGLAKGPAGVPVLRIDIVPDDSQPAESHTIQVTDDGVALQAVDEAGAMRALQWIAGQLDQRRVPYLLKGCYRRTTKIETRIIYSYSAVYGDPLLEPELDPYPDDLLARLSEIGVNGIWLQSVLYNLVPWEAAPELSLNWEKRIAGLRALIKKASRHGIGVYLYCNEPRAMPVSFFANKPEWQGHTEDGLAMLCTSHPDIQRILREAVSRLFREAPDLAGLIAITMSENWTNCYSRAAGGKTNCPRCGKRLSSEVIAEVVRLLSEGASSEKPDARILCWTWGWTAAWGWTESTIASAIAALPDNAIVMCTSEEAIPTTIAGASGQVIDYSMSIPGPGERSMRSWQAAKKRGLRTAAKVQFNNTWECSAVPYLPVFRLLDEHLKRLDEAGVSALQLSWTLGGYPSLNLEAAAEYYWSTETENDTAGTKWGMSELLRGKFGSKAGLLAEAASDAFSEAFREFPFDLDVLYNAPQNYGPANLLYLEPTGQSATMIGFPYDDLKGWRGIYSEAQFASQFKKLSTGWKQGLGVLNKARKLVPPEAAEAWEDLSTSAEAAYLHFYSTYLQIEFVRTRGIYMTAKRADVREKARLKLVSIASEEADNAVRLHSLVVRDSRIGFEASNHYYYTVQGLYEKVLNCRYIAEKLRMDVEAINL